MKLVLFTSLLLLSIAVKSQNLKEIQRDNVIFILFEEGDLVSKQKGIAKELGSVHYSFYQKAEGDKAKRLLPYWFSFDEYETLEDAKMNKRNVSYRVHRSFMRKNKKIILTKKDLENLGELNVVRLFGYNKKNIFIIDKSEIKGNQVLIKEVKFIFTAYE